MKRLAALVLVSLGLLSAGCVVEDRTPVYVGEPELVAFYEPPPLIYIEPGVYVVRDSPYPVYFVNGYYWTYHGGAWYQAARWNAPWMMVGIHSVPYYIVHRDHHRYVRYYGHPHAHVWHEPSARTSRPHYHHGPSRPPPQIDRRSAAPRIEVHPAPAPRQIAPVAPPAAPRVEHRTVPEPRRIAPMDAPSAPRLEHGPTPAPQRMVPPRAPALQKGDVRRSQPRSLPTLRRRK
jgi:hypothetical protein